MFETLKKPSLAFFSIGLAAALLAAACSGKDDSGGASATAPSGGSGDATAPAGSSPTKASGATPTKAADSGGGSDDLPAELKKVSEQMQKLKYTATYAMTTDGQQTELKMVQDPPKQYAAGSIEGNQFIFIYDGKDSYTCFKVGTTGTCTKSSTGGNMLDPRDIADDVDTQATYKKVADRKVNGIDSRCWETSLKTQPGTTTLCVAKSDPVVTLVEGDGLKMELKDFSKSVDSKLFEPPYPVQ
ncbi:hypothetical protein [Tepidiforma sp.]|uniref:hypothetical protein n=1 Tax=Tepidiforma sp. TaxID=2682230 RepID=UPI0021DCD6DC|nr:hypothetical protein [Tepidiforma sp.]MCX7618548.1 hypothetical protein [Tepidiforma sp.]GIW18282.1 MAG: hypothetical protein KatS3mg064_1439 [Tepidiforma sp.]